MVGRQPNSARRVEVSLAARGFRECWALCEITLLSILEKGGFMKKKYTLIIGCCLCIFLVVCGQKVVKPNEIDNDKNMITNNAVQPSTSGDFVQEHKLTKTEEEKSKSVIVRSKSSNNKYELVSEVNETKGIYNVTLATVSPYKEIRTFEVVGRDKEIVWAPNNTKAYITYMGRIWADFCVIDAIKGTLIDHPMVEDIVWKEKTIRYKLNHDRPDPYLFPIEWSPESNKILVGYQWTDSEYNIQNGYFINNIEQNNIKIKSRISHSKEIILM